MLRRIILGIALLPLLAGAEAFAASKPGGSAPKPIGTFGNWTAFSYTENGGSVCYMTLKTHGAANKKLKRGPVLLTITERPAENTKDVFSYNAGYNFKPASDVNARIGKDTFNLFTQKDTAWSRDAMTDHTIATAIRKNPSMTLTGSPALKGVSNVTDTIDLKGAFTAYQAISKACGMPVESQPKPVPTAHKKAKK